MSTIRKFGTGVGRTQQPQQASTGAAAPSFLVCAMPIDWSRAHYGDGVKISPNEPAKPETKKPLPLPPDEPEPLLIDAPSGAPPPPPPPPPPRERTELEKAAQAREAETARKAAAKKARDEARAASNPAA